MNNQRHDKLIKEENLSYSAGEEVKVRRKGVRKLQ
jgi:hypothetical protein